MQVAQALSHATGVGAGGASSARRSFPETSHIDAISSATRATA